MLALGQLVEHQELPQSHDGAHHGLQAVPVGQQAVAPPGRLAPDRRHHSRRQIQGRRKANRTRRLKPASPTFDNSSSTARRYQYVRWGRTISESQKPGNCRIRATCARRGTRQLEFIRFRSADGELIRALPELPEGGEIYQYISGLGEALAGAAAPLLRGSPLVG